MNKLNKNQFDLLHVSSFVSDNPDNRICDGKIPFLNLPLF